MDSVIVDNHIWKTVHDLECWRLRLAYKNADLSSTRVVRCIDTIRSRFAEDDEVCEPSLLLFDALQVESWRFILEGDEG